MNTAYVSSDYGLAVRVQRLYAQPRMDGSRLAYIAESRETLRDRLTAMLLQGSSDPGFVAAVHACCMHAAVANSQLLNSRAEAPALPAFTVEPEAIGESAIRCLCCFNYCDDHAELTYLHSALSSAKCCSIRP